MINYSQKNNEIFKMKVLLLTFSITGKTQHIANTIGEILTESRNHVQHIEIIPIIRKLNLGHLSESPIDYKSKESGRPGF
jgi:hypothetical protein